MKATAKEIERTTKLANELLEVIKADAYIDYSLSEMFSGIITLAHQTLLLNMGEQSAERFTQAIDAWQQEEGR